MKYEKTGTVDHVIVDLVFLEQERDVRMFFRGPEGDNNCRINLI